MMRSATPCLFVGLLGLVPLMMACSGQGSGTDDPDGGSASDSGTSPDGSGGDGGDDGGSSACSPEGTFSGAPITGSPNQWQWIAVPEAKCRNGSATGFGIRLNPTSTKVFIFLEGGGACFNAITCGANAAQFGSTEFATWQGGSGTSGVFDTTNTNNPLRDYSAVFIPYCTGDVHSGVATGANVPGLGTPRNQSFVGYTNIGHYLQRLVPTFANATQVVLTGTSAGAFGAFLNFHRVAQAFCPKPTVLINDSGPVMSDTYLAPCLQDRWRQLWKINMSLPAGCPECIGADGGNLVNMTRFLGRTYPAGKLGLISSDQDSVISFFYGYGKNNCQNIDLITTGLSGATFAAGLAEVRTTYLMPLAPWSTYTVSSVTHTYLGGAGFYSTTVQGQKLTDFVNGLLTGAPAAHVVP